MASRGFFRYIEWARGLRLRGSRQAVLVVLATHCDPSGQTWVSYAKLADETGFSRRTVIRALASLLADGFLHHNGRHEGRGNHWEFACATQAPLLPKECHHVTRRLVRQVPPCPGTGDTLRRVTAIELPAFSDHLNGDLPPPEVDPMTEPTLTLQACRQRFLASDNRKEQVAALVDASRLLFAEPLAGGRAAAFVGRYGHGQNVIDALMAAAGHGAAGPADYMEKVLQGSKQRREGGQRVASGEAVTRFVERREEMWG